MAVSTIGLMFFDSVFATAVLLFGLGVGWNLSFVAATAQMVDLTSASERGRLIGFNDLLSALLGASLALLGGYALDTIGVAALAIGATAIVAAPVLWLLRRRTSAAGGFMSTLWRLPTLSELPRRTRCLSCSRAWRAP